MPIPTPPPDASGGYIVIKYTNGTIAHRSRYHVNPFNADATGSYVTIPSGGETSIQDTATQLMNRLAPDVNSAWTLSLDAVFQSVSGVPIQTFTVTPPATVAGTSGTAAGPTEAFTSLNFRTAGGRRFRTFRFSFPGWVYTSASSVSGANTTSIPQLVLYLTGGLPTGTTHTTQIVGHDGTALKSPARQTWGTNKKLRRRAGNA